MPEQESAQGEGATAPQPTRVERILAQAEQRKRAAQPPNRLTYALARLLGKVIFGLFTGYTIQGREHVPSSGPLLIVGNHLSYLEPPLIGTAIPRRITFMAGYELYEESPWLALALRTMQALPVRRGGTRDLDAIRAAVDLLKRGEGVGIFPEGKISETGVLIRAKPGISLLAHRTHAPILPIGIIGTEHLTGPWTFLTARWRRPRVQVVIGKPFVLDFSTGKPDHQALADQVMQRIAELLPAHYHGLYAQPASREETDA